MSMEHKQEMLRSIAVEIEARKDYLRNEPITTLYIGGGTPTVYSPEELELLIETVRRNYDCSIEELTVEANPDDLTSEYLSHLKRIGVNRLSIGIQSFVDRDLQLMNRRHNAKAALEVVPMAQAEGFDNISIDLIYGVPGQTEDEWRRNLDLAISLNTQHISAYHLSIEPKTIFGNRMKRGLFKPINDMLSESLYRILEERLSQAGFQHYEISNFAQPGFISKHNTGYWTYNKYTGVGPSAHSFDGNGRRWNIANNNKYLRAIGSSEQYWENESLSNEDQYNEFLLTSLRTSWGMRKSDLEQKFSADLNEYFYQTAQRYMQSGKLVDTGEHIAIPTSEFLVSDAIISDLFHTTD